MQLSQRESFITQLYDSCHDTLEKMCYRRLHYDAGYAELIADCIQDSFLAADAHWQMLLDHPNPEGWLMITCQNRLKDALRRDKSRRMRVAFSMDEDASQPMADPHSAIDAWAEGQAGQEMVERICAMLSDGEKRVMQGYFVNQIPMNELAEQQDSSQSAVKSAIWRIRDKAKKLLREKDP